MQKEYNKLFTNTWLMIIGQFSSSLLSMLFVPFYTIVLTTTDYGISDLIATSSALLYPFTTLAIGEAIFRFSLDKNTDHKSVYSTGLFIFLIGLSVVIIASPIIKATPIGDYTILFIVYYFLHCLNTLTTYFIQGLNMVKITSIAGVINTITTITCNLVLLLCLKMGVLGYLLSFILGMSFSLIYQFFTAKLYRYIIPFIRIDKKIMKNMLIYSIPIIPNSISWWISNSSDKYMLNYFTDTSQVGIYSMSYKLPTIIMTIMSLFMSAWKISAADNFGTEKSKNIYKTVYNNCFIANILLAFIFVPFTKPMAFVMYQKDFFAAWQYVPILILGNVFNTLSSFLGTIYTSAKKTKNLSLSVMVAAFSNIVLNFLLIPWFGALGAAIATASSYVIVWLIRLIDTKKFLSFPISYKRDVLLLLLLAVETVLVLIDHVVSLALSGLIALGVIIYFRKFVFNIVLVGFDWIRSKFSKQHA